MKKRVTMKEIADRLNLSINAVSLALNDRAGVSEETRRLVLNAAEEISGSEHQVYGGLLQQKHLYSSGRPLL